MAEPIALLHQNVAQPQAIQRGLFPIGDGVAIPQDWQPRATQYHSHAIPTPFSRAEATRLVIEAALSDGEVKEHPLYIGFKWLLLGIAAGALKVEPADLEGPDFDNLGQALLQVDPEARYLCFLRDRQSGAVLGATYRSCLVWMHSRLDEGELNAFANHIRPSLDRAVTLLADWRAALQKAELWNPAVVKWQAGVQSLLGDSLPSTDLQELNSHASMVGPVWLEVPTGDASAPIRCEPLYLPSRCDDIAKRFIDVCRFQPRTEEFDGKRHIVFRDARGNQGDPLARIALPSGGARADALASGGGTLELYPSTVALSPATERLHLDGPGGLVEMLAPIRTALVSKGRNVDRAHVDACPPLYPDPIRLLKRSGLWADQGAAAVLHSTQARLRLAQAGLSLPGAELTGDPAMVVLTLGDRGSIVLVERVGNVEVLDLRAVGYLLWRVFNGEVAVEGDESLVDVERNELVTQNRGGHPLEPAAGIYEQVSGAKGPEYLNCRLATLQRFVASYAKKVGIVSSLAPAARAFADWAYGSTVIASGRVGNRDVRFKVMGYDFDLFRDAFGRVADQ